MRWGRKFANLLINKWWLWTLGRNQSHSPPTPCVSPQSTIKSSSAFRERRHSVREVAFTKKKAQQRMYFLQQLKNIQPAKDNDGALLHCHRWTLHHRLAHYFHCSESLDLQRRWSAAICRPSRSCTPPGLWGQQGSLWLIPPTLDRNILNLLPLDHQDRTSCHKNGFNHLQSPTPSPMIHCKLKTGYYSTPHGQNLFEHIELDCK